MAARIGLAVLWILGLLALAVVLATWRGALWPFDLRASVLMAASGLAGLARLWWPLWARTIPELNTQVLTCIKRSTIPASAPNRTASAAGMA